jgi:hypothetical protein
MSKTELIVQAALWLLFGALTYGALILRTGGF